MRIEEALKNAKSILGSSYALDINVLLRFTLKKSKEFIFLNPDYELTDHERELLFSFIERRKKHEPVAKITGVKEFFGLDFITDQYTLDPRPDSEVLVEQVIKDIQELSPNKALHILDIGTGTGCLILSILYNCPHVKGTAIDICPNALDVAEKNAQILKLEDRCTFISSDLWENVKGEFDIIISNPPYIAYDEEKDLAPDVLDYDPRGALFSGPTGYEFYEKILKNQEYLNNQGCLYLEFGHTQSEKIKKIALVYGWITANEYKDLSGIIRCIKLKKQVVT